MSDQYQPVGSMTAERWHREGRYARNDRVLLDGQDITDGCAWFDDTEGVAECLRRDADGQFYRDPVHGGALIERKIGVIRVVVGDSSK